MLAVQNILALNIEFFRGGISLQECNVVLVIQYWDLNEKVCLCKN